MENRSEMKRNNCSCSKLAKTWILIPTLMISVGALLGLWFGVCNKQIEKNSLAQEHLAYKKCCESAQASASIPVSRKIASRLSHKYKLRMDSHGITQISNVDIINQHDLTKTCGQLKIIFSGGNAYVARPERVTVDGDENRVVIISNTPSQIVIFTNKPDQFTGSLENYISAVIDASIKQISL